MKRYLNSIKLQPQIIAIIFIEITFAIVTLPEVFAITINVTREITAPADKVWKIISNVDYETNYWFTFKDIKNINKIGNIIEREVTISASPQNSTSNQLVTIFPEQLKIQANLTEGIITDTGTLVLEPISENESRLKVLWDIDLSGIPIIGRGFVENGIKQTTEDALCLYQYRITS